MEESSSKSIPSTPGTAERKTGHKVWENLKALVSVVLLALAIRVQIFELFQIEGPSMEPTLLNGDRIFVVKFLYGTFLPYMDHAIWNWSSPSTGNVVIVKSPYDNVDIVKRVIGVAGDTIEIKDDVVYRNGVAIKQRDAGGCEGREGLMADDTGCRLVEERLGNENYLTSHSEGSPTSSYNSVKVPQGHVYILGDHRDRSNDSRFLGTIPIERIKGRGLVIYWSMGNSIRWSRMFKGLH